MNKSENETYIRLKYNLITKSPDSRIFPESYPPKAVRNWRCIEDLSRDNISDMLSARISGAKLLETGNICYDELSNIYTNSFEIDDRYAQYSLSYAAEHTAAKHFGQALNYLVDVIEDNQWNTYLKVG